MAKKHESGLGLYAAAALVGKSPESLYRAVRLGRLKPVSVKPLRFTQKAVREAFPRAG